MRRDRAKSEMRAIDTSELRNDAAGGERASRPQVVIEENTPTDEELKNLMDEQPKIEGADEYELGTVTLPMSINRFFDLFMSDEAPFNLKVFS